MHTTSSKMYLAGQHLKGINEMGVYQLWWLLYFRIQKKVKKHNLIVASYDVVRNDIDFFSTISWNYCILDEGHIIKNGKTKVSLQTILSHFLYTKLLSP